MRKFSWYTDKEPYVSTYLNGAPKKRYLVLDGIDVVGRAVMHYKPNMKGGHRQNHLSNHELRLLFTKKEIRQLRRLIRGIQRTRRRNEDSCRT